MMGEFLQDVTSPNPPTNPPLSLGLTEKVLLLLAALGPSLWARRRSLIEMRGGRRPQIHFKSADFSDLAVGACRRRG